MAATSRVSVASMTVLSLIAVCQTSTTAPPMAMPLSSSSGQRRMDLAHLFDGESGTDAIADPVKDLPSWLLKITSKTAVLEAEAGEIRCEITREAGIGIQLAKKLRVVSLHPQGAATLSGQIEKGDVLQAIDGQDVQGLTNKEVAQLIRGPEGTAVELQVLRAGEQITASVVRSSLQQEGTALPDLDDDERPPSYDSSGSADAGPYWSFGFSLADGLIVSAIDGDSCPRVAIGDVLLSVDGVRVTGVPTKSVVQMLCGRFASESDLLFKRTLPNQHSEAVLAQLRRMTPAGSSAKQDQAPDAKGGESASEPAGGGSFKKKIGGLLSGWGLFK